jgi:hypothetical protein
MIVEGLLSAFELSDLKEELGRATYVPLPLGDGVVMSVCQLSQDSRNTIADAVEKHWGKPLSIVEMFCRYNSPTIDTSFRIHSDGLIQGVEPDVACVLYLTTGDTGTALLEHPEHGCEGKGMIFREDDGKWEVSEFSEEIVNNAIIYNANRFHSRWPAKASNHRFVIVGFFQEVKNVMAG